MSAIVKNTEKMLDLNRLSLSQLSTVANDYAESAESDMKSAVQNAIDAGRALIAAKSLCEHGQWLDWLKSNWRFSQQMAHKYMTIANYNCGSNLDSATSISEALRMIADAKAEKKLLLQVEKPLLINEEVDAVVVDDDFACGTCGQTFDVPVWHCVECGEHWTQEVVACPNCVALEPQDADEDAVSEQDTENAKPDNPVAKSYFTSVEWEALDEVDRLHLFGGSDKQLNKQDTTSIEWAQWSWNPITGCKHDCPYCYARDIANRFYEQKFEPSIYPERFSAPKNTKVPEKAEKDTAFKNVFTGSMADVFGRWVPTEWVNRILGVVEECPQWNFLFLTKFPQRVHEFGKVPANAWMGTTVDCQDRVANAEKAFAKMGGGIKWLSVEPMLTPLKFTRLDLFDWVVIGGSSRSSQTPEWVPPFDWVVDLHRQARDAGCAIYHKDNLKIGDGMRLKEFPWESKSQTELPQALKYLNIK